MRGASGAFPFGQYHCNRSVAGRQQGKLAQFSFLMVMPPILGEALLDGMKMMKGEAVAGDIPTLSLVVGFWLLLFPGLPGLQVDDKYCEEGQS